MGLSWIHIVLLAAVALLIFGGRGKIPDLMGDVAKGIKNFRQGLADPPEDPKTIGSATTTPTPAPDKEKTTAGQ